MTIQLYSSMSFGGVEAGRATKVGAAHYEEMVGLCEVFAFRVYGLLGKYANSGQSSFFRLAYEVYAEKRDQASAARRVRELVSYYSPDKEFAAALSDTRERR